MSANKDNILISLQNSYQYQILKGVLNICIISLTMFIIDIFNYSEDGTKNASRAVLNAQVILLFLSLMEQSINIVVRGFRKTFQSLLLTFDISITLLALIIGMIFVSFNDLDLLLAYEYTSMLFKVYALATIGKTITVIIFLRVIREIRIVLDVLINSAKFLIDVIGMMGIVVLLFSSAGITIFGGVMNSKVWATYETVIGEKPDDGFQYINFNDYLNAVTVLWVVLLSGWQDPLKMLCFGNPNRNFTHNYFFVAFFVIANLMLLNVLIGFIIDNIVAYLSEDIVIEADHHSNLKRDLKASWFGKIFSFIAEVTTEKLAGKKKADELDGILLEENPTQ